jgi:crossover junction endodeoxyribonuclease RusA
MISFVVRGRAVPKQRAKVGKGNVYTPDETRNYEEYVGWCAKSGGCERLSGNVGVEMVVYRVGKIGDLDNIIKAVCDGMNGICYKDDRQIKKISAEIIVVKREIEERVEVLVVKL